MQRANQAIEKFEVQKLAWSQDEQKRLEEARVTYVEYMMISAYQKITDPAARTLALVSAYQYLSKDSGLGIDRLHEQLQRKVRPIVAAEA